jgi:hypothetical protein
MFYLQFARTSENKLKIDSFLLVELLPVLIRFD